jgi:hypothetical protein
MTPTEPTTLARLAPPAVPTFPAGSAPTVLPASAIRPASAARPDRLPLELWLIERFLDPPALTPAEAAGRITAYVYGNLVVLGALLAQIPSSAASTRGALTILAAGLSTFVAHAFADMLGRRVGHGHRSVLHAALASARESLPIVTSAIVPIGILAIGAWMNWSEAPVQLAAELFICARVGMIGATAERYRGRPSSRRFALVGVVIAIAAALVSLAKVFIAG